MSSNNAELDFTALTEEGWAAQERADEAAIRPHQRQLRHPVRCPQQPIRKSRLRRRHRPARQGQRCYGTEDIDDDDLPDEEPSATGTTGELPGLTDDGGTGQRLHGRPVRRRPALVAHGHCSRWSALLLPIRWTSTPMIKYISAPPAENGSRSSGTSTTITTMDRTEITKTPNIPPPAENFVDTVKQAWPGFEEGQILNWNELLRLKQAHWISKKPAKVPKPLVPSKLSLELIDQEKMFRIPGPASSSVYQRIKFAELHGLVSLEEAEPLEQADLEVFTIDDDDETDNERIGGFTLRDIAIVCDDWESMIALGDVEPVHVVPKSDNRAIKGEPDEDGELDETCSGTSRC